MKKPTFIKYKKRSGGDMEKLEPSHNCWQEKKMAQPLWKTVWQFLKKLKIELSFAPEKELKAGSQRYLYIHFHSIIITKAKM